MKKVICVLLVIIGLILPFYLLISGIIETVNGINPFDAGAIIIGVIKIFFCGVGSIPAYLGVTIVTKTFAPNKKVTYRTERFEMYVV